MVKMKKSGLGLVIPKTLRIGGVTFYQRGGQVIGRVSESREKRSNTLAQFIQRQKMRHTTALWKMLRYAEPMFTERANAYQDFASLANGLPPVYVETGDDRSRRTTLAGERRVCRLYERLGTGTRHWRPLLAADNPDPLHALPTVHDRRSPAACRQELWRHHRQALSFAKIVDEGYTLKILFEKIKRE